MLTVTFLSGDISLMNNYDDLSPAVIRSGLKGENTHLSPEQHIHVSIDHMINSLNGFYNALLLRC